MMFLHAPVIRKSLIRKSLARLMCGVSAVALFASAASATPANGTFVAGGAGGSITPSGGDVTINTGTDPRSVITWDSFNIDNGDTVIFNQLNNQSIALNKVTGPLAQSTIDGILQSNGHVWILNPAGVAFGANANIDVGALLATTADIDNATFMATDPTTGTFTFTDAGGTGAIIVANGADLDTTGLLALVAPMVTNSGDLTSSHGDVLLGGAEAFRIKFASTARNNGAAFNELLVTDFIIDGGSSTAAAGGDVVHQTSTGRAIGGRVIADASRVGGGAFLNMEGLVEAQNVGTLSGDVMLLGGVDITAGALGATATDAVKTDNMTIVAPGTASVQGTAVTIGNAVGPLNTGGNTNSSTGAVAFTGTTGDVTIAADLQATAGDVNIQATNGNIDVAELIALGSITVSGRDIDLANGNQTGTTTVLRTTNGALSLTATNGDISKGAGIVDIDVGTNVTLSGNATGATSAWAIDAVPGTVTADDFNVQFLRVGATGSVGVGDVTASQSAEVISTGSTVKVGNVSSDNNITLSGTDIDLTGTGGSLQSTGGTVSVTATGGGANNISATGAIDIDGDVVTLSGPTTGTVVDIDADNGAVTANAVTASAGSASIDATGNVDVDGVSATTTARVVSSAGAVDVGNVTGPGGITVSGTDVDLTGTGGSLQSTGGTVSVTASGGGANNISAAGAIDIDGDNVTVSGLLTGDSIDIDADNGAVTANALTATGTSVLVDATGNIDVDDVTATATGVARVVSSAGEVDVGDVSGNLSVTISGTDVDLTGTNGKVIAAGGVTTIGASGGGANNISSAGAMDIDGGVVILSGSTSAVGNLDITSAGGTTAGDVSGGATVVVRSVVGVVDVDNVTGTGTVQVVADANAVDVGNVTGPGGITISGTDIDLTGTGGSLQSTGGTVSVTASGGGVNNISAAGAIDIDGDVVSLSGPVTGTSIDIDADNGTVTTNAVSASSGSASIDATGNIDVDDVSATTTARVVSSTGAVDVGNVTGTTGITVSGLDVDLTGTGGSIQSTGGTVSVTASGGGANNISSAGAIDIDGDTVALSGPLSGTSVDIDADNGTVTASAITASAGSASIDATGNVDVDNVSATTTARVVSGTGAVDVGDVTGTTGVTVSGTDIDFTGANGDVAAAGGTVSLTATGGGANNISSAGALDVDGNVVTLSGNTSAVGDITIDAATGNVSTNGSITSTGGLVSVVANAGSAILQAVQALTGVTLTANQISATTIQGASVDIDADAGTVTATGVTATGGSVAIDATGDVDVDNVMATTTARVVSSSGAVDVGNVTGPTGITISGTDVDLTGTGGSVQSSGGAVSITANGGGANNISSAGAIDIDGDSIALTGPLTGTSVHLRADTGALSANDITATAGDLTAEANTTIDIDDVTATGALQIGSAGITTQEIDVGDISGDTSVGVFGTDVDLTGASGSVRSANGFVQLTVTNSGNNISAAGAIDIDAQTQVLLFNDISVGGNVTIDAGTFISGGNSSIGTSAGSVAVNAVGNIDIDGVTATTTASVISTGGSVDVGDVAGPNGVTVTGTDIDFTGTNRDVVASAGTVALTATGGGANNISSNGALDIDGNVVTLSGNTSATGDITIDAATGNVSTNGSITSTGGLVSIVANAGNAVLQAIQAATGVTLTANQVSATNIQGASVDVDTDAGTVIAMGVTATGGSVAIDSTGNIDVDNVSATTSARVVSTTGAVDVGDVSAVTQADISGTDVDLTGANGSVQVTTGTANLTATGGGANNISAAGAIDIDGHQVNLLGTTTGTSIDIDATNGPVTGNDLTATGGSVSVDASNGIDVDDVTATTTVRVVSPFGAVDVGNVMGPAGVTISGTDVDLTGAGGSVQSANGVTSLAATGGGANNVSSAGAMDIDGNSIVLSGPVVGGGAVSLTADTTDISSAGIVDVTGTSVTVSGPVNGTGGVALSATTGDVSVDSAIASAGGTVALSAVNGDIDVTSVSGATGATFVAQDVDVTGSVNGGAGRAALTATAGDISTPGTLDIDGGSISLAGPVQAGTGIDLDASTGGITATADMTSTAGSAVLRAVNGAISVQGVKAPDGISMVGAAVNFAGMLMTQGQVFLEALTGALTGSGTSSVAAPNGGLTARALGGAATLNNVVIGGDLSLVGGSSTMTGVSTVGGTATLQALTGNVHVAGSVAATGGILLIEAPSGSAVINSIASNSDVSLVVLDLDLTGTISAGDQFNLTPAGSGRTIIIGGSGGTDGVTLRRPQGFTLDASEVTRIIASKLQIDAGANDLALLDATFDPAALQSLFLGADANARIIAAGNVTGLPHLQLGFVDGAANARPGLILVSGALGEDTAADRLASLRLESSEDIVIGTQAFLDEFERADGNLDLSILGEPDLARFNGTQDHVFIAADQLRLFAPGEIVQLNTGTSFVGAGVVFGEAPAGEGTIVSTGGGPERVNLFGTVIRSTGERVTSFEAGLEPNLLGPGLSQNGELRLNLCVIGDSSSCSIAILREAQESARSRNSALSSLTNSTLFGFEDDDDDDDEEEDLGGVAGSGNEGLWGVGLP
ncbi:Flagellar hook-length control protein FliK [Candidatus Phaeomarinobacter ectocarpi]|uniref:Flagellar hook-length control protein FliK n=1 Tax=Candidatus Phaeomarinibacter ectocarpi TaxID=1458461 RepID=X5MCN8_9HYPH|nr:S-layer family protein [Candidatus Phaeomarinobacter ectocarpi]CDO59377.1 Flagellar hook-length control protein FliK [Candidatus Phaeomarinobacter ectocarpi]